uniref:BPI1 domain-containing protein n=1 Tax=Caenorhabditis tropicalis TaxID=1561998 RepID=A0A1I7UGF3_9PELO
MAKLIIILFIFFTLFGAIETEKKSYITVNVNLDVPGATSFLRFLKVSKYVPELVKAAFITGDLLLKNITVPLEMMREPFDYIGEVTNEVKDCTFNVISCLF